MKRIAHSEGSITRTIEQTTAKIPSSAFLTASLASMTLSAIFEITGNTRMSRFVGQWAPTLLIMGVYNKMVKMIGPI